MRPYPDCHPEPAGKDLCSGVEASARQVVYSADHASSAFLLLA
ncbi:MAG TPA: hypothetical protein PKK23_21360 [Nitrospirales bacterium]|nr:hypothetical protein [Nitrospirales bacterium]